MAAPPHVVVNRRDALIVAAVALLSLALWPVEIDTAFGLPAHPLLLHVPVVFVPILGLAALAMALGFDRHRLAIAAFSVLTLVSTLLTVGAGQAFEEERERDITDKATLSSHADSGETLRFSLILLTLLLVSALFTRRNIVVRILIALLAINAIFWVIRTGHLGSTLVWDS